MSNEDKVILFDGVCKLCNGWVRFVVNNDMNRVFKLAAMQSDEGQAFLKHFKRSADEFETMLYIDGNVVYEKSAAFFKIIREMTYPVRIMAVFFYLSCFTTGLYL